MKALATFVSCMILSLTALAQVNSPVGIYYLEDVMETASGIKINPDSTFEFFFSQGALDRTGSGKWNLKDGYLVLQSDSAPAAGFVMVKSEKNKKDSIQVVVKEENKMLLSFIYVQVTTATKGEFVKMSEEGSLKTGKGNVKEIALRFEICPERVHSFKPKHADDNYFEFTISQKIMDVYFEHTSLKLTTEGLQGGHPLLKGNDFFYRKN